MSRLIRFSCTRAEAQQLLAYVNDRERSGWYYAPRADFERRHASLKEILERVLSAPVTKDGEQKK